MVRTTPLEVVVPVVVMKGGAVLVTTPFSLVVGMKTAEVRVVLDREQ